jgi:hypothetical protein
MDRGISRPKVLIGVAALLCVLVIPLTATGSVGGSGGPEATASGVKQQVKKLKRKVKRLQQQVEDLELQPGPQGPAGPQGEQGAPGQDATKLFAYIRDFAGSPGATGNVESGDGVTAVSDPAGDSAYTVSFNQSLENCVVQAVPGVGDPPGTPSGLVAVSLPIVNMAAGGANDVNVTFRLLSGNVTDTAFLITAFC